MPPAIAGDESTESSFDNSISWLPVVVLKAYTLLSTIYYGDELHQGSGLDRVETQHHLQ